MSKASKYYTPSHKQYLTLTWWIPGSVYADKDGIICDGSIRSGKTTMMSLSFVLWAMHTFDGENFAFCGKTINALRRNVIKQLKQMLKEIGYEVTEHRSENYITIKRNTVENDFYLFGGKDEGSQDLIQGVTLAGVFFDEAALMPQSFVNQATGRCSVNGSKMWFNCNPEAPDHYIKTEWIDRVHDLNFIHIHFTMRDNPSLSEKIIQRYESMYSGVFYDRFILGLWVLASGLIFKYFAEDPEPYLFDESEVGAQQYYKLVMGIDFGGNGSKTTMVLSGYTERYNKIWALEEQGLPITEDIDSKRICDEFIAFYRMCIQKYGRVDYVFPDSASSTMINSLKSAAQVEGLPYRTIVGCRKNEIKDRPKTIDLLFNTGRLKINKRCQQVIKAISSMRWDEKNPDIPEDKNIGNCNDWYDAFCYTWLDFVEWIDLRR